MYQTNSWHQFIKWSHSRIRTNTYKWHIVWKTFICYNYSKFFVVSFLLHMFTNAIWPCISFIDIEKRYTNNAKNKLPTSLWTANRILLINSSSASFIIYAFRWMETPSLLFHLPIYVYNSMLYQYLCLSMHHSGLQKISMHSNNNFHVTLGGRKICGLPERYSSRCLY